MKLNLIGVLLFVSWCGLSLAQNTTVYGTELPADAAPYDQQVLRVGCDNTATGITFDFAVSVYQRHCLSAGDLVGNQFQDTLVDLNSDFDVIPASAESWSVSEDGRTWTFNLREGLMWSDGTPLTAYDYEATFRFSADPENGWDFAWFYSFLGPGGIENWSEVVDGSLPPEELGVRAVDDLTLTVTTVEAFPPLPNVMNFSFVMQKQALEEHGPFYNNDPETSVSAGPFMLVEFDPGNRIVLEANPMYTGYRPPNIQRIEAIFMSPATFFAALENDEIDIVSYQMLTPADFALIERDPVLSDNYLRHYGDFRTDYLLFDTTQPPFDNLDVRTAFAKAINREAIVAGVFTEIKAMPAHSMLMPGFPGADVEGNLTSYQAYDCEQAQAHLADAGYPGGEGFPAQEMWLRGEAPAMAAVYQAVAASISQCLDVDIAVSNKDGRVYMDALNAQPTELTLGAVSYGMDFLDQANLLGIWVSTGRHAWFNETYDDLVSQASTTIGDDTLRDELFAQAEEVLVSDVGGAFIAHRWQGDLFQPDVQGDFRIPNATGISGIQWGNSWVISDIYIAETE
jgi:peptide/nickel transport system substrate-binding protein/oligopeptide transport system substrate-binding protein